MVAVRVGSHQDVQFIHTGVFQILYYHITLFIFPGVDEHMEIPLADQRCIPLPHIKVSYFQPAPVSRYRLFCRSRIQQSLYRLVQKGGDNKDHRHQ